MNWMSRSPLLENAPVSLDVLNHRFAISLAAAGLAIATLGIFPTLLVALETGVTVGVFATVIASVINLLLLVILLRTHSRTAVVAILAVATIAALFPNNPAVYLSASLALLGAAAFAPSSLYIALNYIILIRFSAEAIAFAYANPNTILDGNLELYRLTFPIYTLALVSVISRFFIVTAQRAAVDAQRAASLLQAGAEIGQVSSNISDLRTLLPEVANLLVRRFDLYYARIFLLDIATGQLRLAASSGDTGSQTAARAEQPIPVGSAGAVGQTALRGRLNVVRASDSTLREGWQLHTQAQAALPLLDGKQVVGVLDAQSRYDNAFDAIELQALQIAANQIAAAIRNARLIAEQIRVAEENRRLFSSAQENLQEIERLNRQLTGTVWERYLNRTQEASLTSGVTVEGEQMLPVAEWTPPLKQAGLEREPVRIEREDGAPVIAVPLILRGEVIGAIEVETDESVSALEALELTQAVGQQLALSLENARLYEETGYAAAQQQRINAIASRMQQTNSVDELLRIALTELSSALGAEAGAVRLTRVRLDELETETGRNGS